MKMSSWAIKPMTVEIPSTILESLPSFAFQQKRLFHDEKYLEANFENVYWAHHRQDSIDGRTRASTFTTLTVNSWFSFPT
jgi:hypothetical protein